MQNKDTWSFYKDMNEEWRWKRKAQNGNIIGASTEGYKNRQDCFDNAVTNGYIKNEYEYIKPPVQAEVVPEPLVVEVEDVERRKGDFGLNVAFFLLASLFSLSIILMITKPSFQSDTLVTEKLSFDFGEEVTLQTGYPEFELDGDYLIEFSNGKSHVGDRYISSELDYEEGNNEVRFTKVKDYYFFELKADNSVGLKVEVDTKAPMLDILEYRIDSESARVRVKSEVGTKVFVDGKQIGVMEEEVEWVELKDEYNGENLYTMDSFGNKSEKLELDW